MESFRTKSKSWTMWLTLLGCVLIAVLGVVVLTSTHIDHHVRSASAQTAPAPTVVTIPSSAFTPGGGIDLSKVPDFVPAISNGKIVGYIPKSQLFPPQSTPSQGGTSSSPYVAPTPANEEAQSAQLVKTVYGADLVTVVGHMYPGVGFVPLGATPEPSSTVTTVTGYGTPPTG